MLRVYFRLMERYPLIMQSLQAGVLMAVGDLSAQTIVERTPIREVDLKRTARFYILGNLYIGPSISIWYRILDRYVGSKGRQVVIKKVLIDQCIFSPAFLASILMILSQFKGDTIEKSIEHVKRDHFDILLNSYKLWPAVQLINFYMVPLNYQMIFVQVVSIFWNTYLSWRTNSDNFKNL